MQDEKSSKEVTSQKGENQIDDEPQVDGAADETLPGEGSEYNVTYMDLRHQALMAQIESLKAKLESQDGKLCQHIIQFNKHAEDVKKPFWKRLEVLGPFFLLLSLISGWIVIPYFSSGDLSPWRWVHRELFKTNGAISESVKVGEIYRDDDTFDRSQHLLHSTLDTMIKEGVPRNQEHIIYASQIFTTYPVNIPSPSCFILSDLRLIDSLKLDVEEVKDLCGGGNHIEDADEPNAALAAVLESRVSVHTGMEIPFRVRRSDKVSMRVTAISNSKNNKPHELIEYFDWGSNGFIPVQLPASSSVSYSVIEFDAKDLVPDPTIDSPQESSVSINLNEAGSKFIEEYIGRADIPLVKVDVTLVVAAQ